MQSNKISFKGQKIYVGIDVHLKKWSVTVITEKGLKRTHPQKADAKELFEFLNRHYPDGEYLAVYESGFSGFATYYALKEVGIDCIVINAADVPSSQYENVMKTDVIDSEKLARALKGGLLRPIYIREKENLDDRGVVRIRKTIQKKMAGDKTRTCCIRTESLYLRGLQRAHIGQEPLSSGFERMFIFSPVPVCHWICL